MSFSVTASSFKGDTIPVTNAYSVSKDNFKLRYTQHLPAGFSDKKCFEHLKGLGLKDVNADDITLLIGADVPSAIIATEVREGPKNTPYAVLTKLGWTLFGVAKGCSLSDKMVLSTNHIRISNEKCLDELVQSFWSKESYGTSHKLPYPMSMVERKIAVSMEESTAMKGNKYCVKMLWKDKELVLPNNRDVAKKRLLQLLKRLRAQPDIFKLYSENIKQYVTKGYAKRMSYADARVSGDRSWYLPHHPVFNVNKPGKLRVVFDAASRYKGKSLNDVLHTGPDLVNKLIGVLLRFRNFPFTLVADIEGMFHQVKVSDQDRDSLRFLWVNSEDDSSIVTYQMLVHIFGATDSPCCAAYALRRTAEDNKDEFSIETYNTVIKNFYVDDLLKSFKTEKDLLQIAPELIQMLAKGGFHLAKFISNSRSLLSSLPESQLAHKLYDMDFSSELTDRALGVKWHVERDEFLFTSLPDKQPVTKRGILKTVSSIFDPLGFLTPFTVRAKIILQNLWRSRCGWDDPIDPCNSIAWDTWLQQLKLISSFKLSRCYITNPEDIALRELHCFTDASELAFGAVCYMRTQYHSKQITCSLITSKSRVAPIKPMTMPRYELQGAVLGARLTYAVQEEIDVPIESIHYWVDSTLVLQYIYNETKRFKVFVGNRVAEIRESSDPKQWHHVDSKENPADDITRGLDITKMGPESRWIRGPEFLLKDPSHWPEPPEVLPVDSDDPEVRRINVLAITVSPFIEVFERYSKWTKAFRVVAWILRFYKNCREGVDSSMYLTPSELKKACEKIYKLVQAQWYQTEIKALSDGLETPNNSKLRQLRPFLDENGILRVGGRLKNARIPFGSKHQIILPGGSWVSKLLAEHHHKTSAEAGLNHLISLLRVQFWIVGSRTMIKRLLRTCFHCRRRNAKLHTPVMAPLPECRLAIGCPTFYHTGIDYFGPILVKYGRTKPKRWCCLFTCMTTRAVHLEVAESLSTDDFINVLRRFQNRRGNPKAFYSDCGSNFKGAEAELRESLKMLDQSEIGNYTAKHDIEWNFNPPDAPHMGGAWERLIRCVKIAFRNLVSDRLLTDFQLMTLLTEVESIVNSRPLTQASDNVDDLEALTPNHFLLGKATRNAPFGSYSDKDICSRKRWRQVQTLADHYWKRFRKEYLPLLTKRGKWLKEERNIEVGDMVLLAETNVPRGYWQLARVIEVYPGEDGVVRVAEVKTKSGKLTRPVAKLCVLEEASQ